MSINKVKISKSKLFCQDPSSTLGDGRHETEVWVRDVGMEGALAVLAGDLGDQSDDGGDWLDDDVACHPIPAVRKKVPTHPPRPGSQCEITLRLLGS